MLRATDGRGGGGATRWECRSVGRPLSVRSLGPSHKLRGGLFESFLQTFDQPLQVFAVGARVQMIEHETGRIQYHHPTRTSG